jgi:hypothetical protein
VHAVCPIRFESGALGQFEVSWMFRGETFYDGYVVNALMDACYASAASRGWEPVRLDDWRGGGAVPIARPRREHDGPTMIKDERLPDGRRKLIVKDEATGEFEDVIA